MIADQENAIRLIIRKIREHPHVKKDAYILFAPESNTANASVILANAVNGMKNVVVMEEVRTGNGNVVPGVLKRDKTASQMATCMKLELHKNTVCFSDHMIGINESPEALKRELCQQWKRFDLDPYTNKIHGKHGGANDDLIIAVLMLTFYYDTFITSNVRKYVELRQMVRQLERRM